MLGLKSVILTNIVLGESVVYKLDERARALSDRAVNVSKSLSTHNNSCFARHGGNEVPLGRTSESKESE